MGRWFQSYAFDMIGQITFSKRLGFLDSGEDVLGFIAMIDGANKYSSVIGLFPTIHAVIMKVLVRLGGGLPIDQFIKDQISNIKQKEDNTPAGADGDAGPVDFVTKLVRENKNNPDKLSDLDITISASGNMLAGSDTTSISLSAILYNLIQNPKTLARLRQELQDASDQKRISQPITFQGARTCIGKNISFLEMYKVIPETIQEFDFELESQGKWQTHNAWFVKPTGFRCKVKRRI